MSAISSSRRNSICRFAPGCSAAGKTAEESDRLRRRRRRDQFADHRRPAVARRRIAKSRWLEERGLGKGAINYKLRDWLFSRQRYWGEPFPIVWRATASIEALAESELPVVPPPLEDFKPTGTGEPPLAKAKDWVRYSDKATRETNTMPQWAGSCWYYLRFCDPQNDERFVGEEAERYWMGGVNDEARMTNDDGMHEVRIEFVIRHARRR